MKPLFIIVPILLVGGIIGAGFVGVVPIPGITPKKADAKAGAMYGEAEDSAIQEDQNVKTEEPISEVPVNEQGTVGGEETSEPPAVTVTSEQASEPARDPIKGAKALAKYWDEIEVTKLIAITETYSESELAQVLYFMQKKKVAELLTRVSAERASKLSRELQKLASVVEPAS